MTALWKPHLEIEAVGGRLIVTRRSWLDPARLREFLDEAAGLLEDLSRASRR